MLYSGLLKTPPSPYSALLGVVYKDPQCLIAHPNTGVKTLEDLKGRPIYVSASASANYWPVLKAKYGFTDDQKRPYNFNPGPFLADKNSAQQGYVTSEPFAIEKQAGFKPVVFLLADYGYTPYATTIETKRELVEKNPDLVQRFVDASIKGWYSYLENPAPGNELIKKDNPEMKDDQLAYGIQKLKDYGLLTSGDAAKQGIGAMTRMQAIRWIKSGVARLEAGVFIANPHTYIIEDGGRKKMNPEQLQFKEMVDPYGLLNPGKLRSWMEQ